MNEINDGSYKNYYENGNLKGETELNSEGIRHGITKIYHENGQLQAQLEYTNGKQKDGEIISFHDNGNKARCINLLNGNYEGDFIEWHKNGVISRKGVYENDKVIFDNLHFPTGEIKIRRVWNNEIKSEEYEYDIDGNIICEYKNKEGKIEQTNYYSNGNIRFEVKKNSLNENDIDFKDTHEYKSYWINGNLMCKSKFNYKYYNQHFPKTDVVEEKFLENGDPILSINKDSSDSNSYSSGERKETEEIKKTEIDGDQKVVTGYYKNGTIKFIKYYKSKWNKFLSRDVYDEYGKWIFYNIDGEILNERNFIYNEENDEIIEVKNNRNEDLYKKIIDNLKFNIYLDRISKNDKYTFYKIKIEFDDEEEFEGIDLLDIHENDGTVIGETQLSKDITKIIRGIALTSSRNGENIFQINELGKIKEDKFFRKTEISSHYVREHNEIYKNFHYENIFSIS